MTDKPKPAPHPAAANDAAHAKPKAKAARPAAPKPAIPRVDFHPEPAQSKGKAAMMVGTVLAAGALIGHAVVGVGRSMLRRGR